MQRFFLVVVLLLFPLSLSGQEVTLKTAGGGWFWGDVQFFHGWHIQKNVKSGKFRLLDARQRQWAYGDLGECRRRLDEIQAEEGLLPMAGTAVILMHGFGSNTLTTRPLAEWLKERQAYDHVFNMAYPSTQQSILEHARQLDLVVRNLPPTIRRIDFIGHSLGSIVMRRYLSGPLDPHWRVPLDRREARNRFSPDSRVGRFVMLGPPNNGAEIARKLIGRDPVRRHFTGPSGDELGINWDETHRTLGIPCCPFGIISGGRGDETGFTALISGDDDGIVSTEGTKLEGAAEWVQFHVGHGAILLTEEIFEAVLRFMESESFGDVESSED